MDLQHDSLFPVPKMFSGKDYNMTANSKLVITTLEAWRNAWSKKIKKKKKIAWNISLIGESHLIWPSIKGTSLHLSYSLNCKLLIVSNPEDILTYMAWKISSFPKIPCY